MEDYWPIYDITFTKKQLWWLIYHLAELKDGDWPEKPGRYIKELKTACKKAREQGYEGYCIACPHIPCLNPDERTPNRIRKERNINRVLEIAAEVEVRIGLVINYMSGRRRPTKKIYKQRISNKN